MKRAVAVIANVHRALVLWVMISSS